MSYDPRLASRPYDTAQDNDGDGNKGSVQVARGRLQTAQRQNQLPNQSRIVGLPQRPNQLVSQFSLQKQQQKQQKQSSTPPDTRSNTAPLSQWPILSQADHVVDFKSHQKLSPPNRGPPPQRPPRPVSDELPQQSISHDDYRDSYLSDDVFSPTSASPSSRPLTNSSAISESSSLGSIPDFPVPLPPMSVVQPLPRRQASLGPPPSARRGPSSYYTQLSYVSPIAEESETRSNRIRSHHRLFASSNVFPLNEDDYHLQDDDMRSEDEETVTSDYERGSTLSDNEDRNELVQPALLRQASLGRRTKPSLMTIKSVDSFGEKKTPASKRKPVADSVDTTGSAASIGSALLAARDGIAGRGVVNTSLGSGSVLLDNSSSSEDSLAAKRTKPKLAPLNLEKDLDKDLEGYLERDLEKEDLVSPIYPVQQGAKQTTLADRVGKRRPPRIDVDAVRDAEARGSLTSLPGLIRRATRLAANLDRGRTASRLGLDLWESGAPEKGRRSGSLTDMLAAFPPPGEATPTGDRTPNPRNVSKWPSARGAGYTGTDSTFSLPSGRRRCCGMPMWTFVTLLIVLLFLVAAAVIIPIVLIVIPKMKSSQVNAPQSTSGSNSNNPISPLAPAVEPTSGQNNQCDAVITCQNSGVAILHADRSCNCVCINGFTGKACEIEADAACSTTNVSDTADNATVGSSIPRLLESAQTNFSIPLDPAGLLSLFSELALSCNTENALVTFNGLASRSVPNLIGISLEPSKSLPFLDSPHSNHIARKASRRQAIGNPGVSQGNQNQQNSVTTATSTPQASASPTISSTPVSGNATAIDFARIGILLLLQETRKIADAANAQVLIQDFLSNDRDGDSKNGNTVDLGSFEMDLVKFSIEFRNGTVLQAKPAPPANSSAQA